MKVYTKPYIPIDFNKTYKATVPVGCRRCWNTWYEEDTFIEGMPRINGPSYKYDMCDNCITEEEKNESK